MDWNEWRTGASAPEGDDYPVGSVAVLAKPQPIDTGLYSSGRTASRFVKRSAGGGRWVSYPGSDIYFNTLGDLQLALDESGNAILEIIVPDSGDAGEVHGMAEDAAQVARDGIEYPDDSPPDTIPLDTAAAAPTSGGAWKWLLAAAAALLLLGRK